MKKFNKTNRIREMVKPLAALFLFMALLINANAQVNYLNETFDSNPSLMQWTVDRYAPAAFVSDNSLGSNVLKISINGPIDGAQSRPSNYSSSFYNTQGRAFDQTGLNATILKGSLYLPSDWASKHRRTDMWVTGLNASNATSSYPIIGFRNITGTTPTFSYWDDNIGWIDYAAPTSYDTWYNFEIRIVGSNVEYYMDNALVGTISSFGTVKIGNVIMQAYNFNDANIAATSGTYDNSADNSYDAYWDNVITQSNIYNVTSQTYAFSVQAAINAASPGDVIEVGAGTYTEDIVINKPLSLLGANAGIPYGSGRVEESILQPASNGQSAIQLTGYGTSDNVTINGFEITGAMSNNAIYCGGDGPSNLNIKFNYIHDVGTGRGSGNIYPINYRVNIPNPDNVNITDNFITNISNGTSAALGHSAAIWIGQSTANGVVTNLKIQRNTISNVYSGLSTKDASGIYIGVAWGAGTGSISNGLIENNEISAVSGGIAYGIQLSGKTPGMIVSNNTINNVHNGALGTNAAVGVAVPNTNTGYATVSIINNSLTNVLYGISNGNTGALAATCNWFGLSTAAEVATKTSGNVQFLPFSTSASPVNCLGTGPVVNTTKSLSYMTIQDAMNAAVAGDVIEVAEGSYEFTSQMNIDKPGISILGQGNVIFQANNAAWSTVNGYKHLIGLYAGTEANPVTISNITLNCNTQCFGLNSYNNAYGTLSNVTVNGSKGAGLTVNGSTIIATNLNTASNAWGAVNVDPGSGVTTPSAFTLNSGTLAENTQIWSDGSHVTGPATVTVNATGYNKYNVGTTKIWTNRALTNCATITKSGETTIYSTIQAAIDAADAGDVINVTSGTFTENININKRVSVLGAGSGETGGTILTQTTAGAGDTKIGVVQLNASGLSAEAPILIKDLRIQPVGMAGISVGRFTEATATTVEYLKFDNVYVVGTNTNPSTEQERGFYVDNTSTANNLEFVNCAFNNLTYGWYFQKQVSADASNVSDVDITNTLFNHNNHKGIYAEKLSNATITNCTFDQNGMDAAVLPSYFAPWSCGVDINTKAGSYSNIAFANCIVTNNGIGGAKEGAAMTIKARSDGATYGAFPATLSNVSISGCTITGNERGIRIGEPTKNNPQPLNVVISNNTINNNRKHYTGTDGTDYGDVVNMLSAPITLNSEIIIAGQNVWYVEDGESIQAVINAANAGDVIEVAAGTYPENVIVDKRLTIQGAGETTIISGSGGVVLQLAAGTDASNRMIVKNLKVTGGTTGLTAGSYTTLENVISESNTNYGINLNPLTDLVITNCSFVQNNLGLKLASTASASYITITGSHFDNNQQGWYSDASSAVEPDLDNVSITNTTFSGNAMKGFYTERLSNATFDNVTIDNSGSTAYDWGAGIDINLKWKAYSNITIQNSTITNCGIGALNGVGATIKARDDGSSYGANPATLSNVTIDNVIFTGNKNGLNFGEPGKDNNGPAVVQVKNSTFSNVVMDMNNFSKANIDALIGNTFTGAANNFTIEDHIYHKLDNSVKGLVTWVADNLFVTPSSGSVQRGIDAAIAGDAIMVAAGTYTEQLHITTNDLTIQGVSKSTVTLKSPASLPLFFTTGTNQNHPIVFVDGVNEFTLKNMTVDGDGKGNANYRFQGIGFWNAGGTLLDVDVYDILDTPFSGAQHGVAVYAHNNTNGPYTINCTNMVIDDYQKNGMALSGTGLTVALNNITTIGAGPTSVTAQNGIQVAYGAGGTITNSNVSGNIYTGEGWSSAGILLYQGSSVAITNTTISDNYTGLDVNDCSGSITNSTVSNQNSDSWDGIYLRKYQNTPMTFDVSGVNVIGHNKADSWGIYVSATTGTIESDITQCQVSNWGLGVSTREATGGVVNVLTNNNVISNNTDGYNANTVTPQVATLNYWGTCPSISGLATYFPYWSTVSGTPGAFTFGGQINNITAAATNASVCAGSSTTIYATGGSDYLWDNGLGLGSSKVVSPAATTLYNVTSKDANGCAGAFASVEVIVNPAPVVAIATASVPGGTQLTASGATSYVWNTGSTENPYVVNPTSTTTYSVIGTTENGCTGTASTVVTVVTVSAGSNQVICNGGSATLTATVGGVASPVYAWSPGGATTQSITVSPNATTPYTVTVSGVSSTATVFVNPKPIANAGPDKILVGGGVALEGSASGGSAPYAYLWSPGGMVVANPTVSSANTYALVVTDAFGCQSIADEAVVTAPAANTYTVSGNIAYAFGTVNPQMHDVQVKLVGTNGTFIGYTAATGNGDYAIPGVPTGDYTVYLNSPKAWGGVTSTDITAIQNHYRPHSPIYLQGIKRLAADVVANSTSHIVNADDRDEVNKRRIGQLTSFATGDWVFTKAVDISSTASSINYAYTAATTSFSNITITVGSVNLTGQDYRSLCFGDVNASYTGLKILEAEEPIVHNSNGDDWFELTNYPNPFNGSTTISYYQPVDGHATIQVYDLTGNRVGEIQNQAANEGEYKLTFNGQGLASGVYFYVLTLETSDDVMSQTGKMVIYK